MTRLEKLLLGCVGIFFCLGLVLGFRPVATPAFASEQELEQNRMAAEPVSFPLDLNTASENELMLLKGIGQTRAHDIVRFRQQNGPFCSVEALLDVPGIGPTILSQVREFLEVPGGVPFSPSNKTLEINVNLDSAEDLQQLPGIGAVKAQAIVEYREAFGAFLSPEDLLNVSGIGEKTLENIRPYVVF
ncbi:MAG TPA: helix-hairpin-helix domain-containing protein [Thermotogota bacterium]|nr:helix-hairpin-helix domain-containing protein [Thermotogota bacterium]